jgi:uncharacterized protein YgiB involved in biofilm formation
LQNSDFGGIMKRKFDRHLLPITSAVAAVFMAGGCSRGPDMAGTDIAVCKDQLGKRVPDSNCGSRTGGGYGYGWYYIGRGGQVPRIGGAVSDGSSTPAAGKSYGRASASTVTRGGFGLSGHSSAS